MVFFHQEVTFQVMYCFLYCRYEEALSKLKQALKTESRIPSLAGTLRRQMCHCHLKVNVKLLGDYSLNLFSRPLLDLGVIFKGKLNAGHSYPLGHKSDQHQFSPNNICRSSRVKVMIIIKLITQGRIL